MNTCGIRKYIIGLTKENDLMEIKGTNSYGRHNITIERGQAS